MKKEKSQKTAGEKLAELRKKKNLSLEELADQTGLKAAYLRNVEEGKAFIPVGDLLTISRVLTVNPDELLKGDREKELKKKRAEDFRRREEAYNYTVLTPDGKDKHLRAFLVVIPPRSEHPSVSYQHEGEEFVYVLRGEVEVRVGQKKHHLKQDDALHFDSGIKHRLMNPGAVETVLIITIYTK
mgnify:CR=1 FL=1